MVRPKASERNKQIASYFADAVTLDSSKTLQTKGVHKAVNCRGRHSIFDALSVCLPDVVRDISYQAAHNRHGVSEIELNKVLVASGFVQTRRRISKQDKVIVHKEWFGRRWADVLNPEDFGHVNERVMRLREIPECNSLSMERVQQVLSQILQFSNAASACKKQAEPKGNCRPSKKRSREERSRHPESVNGMGGDHLVCDSNLQSSRDRLSRSQAKQQLPQIESSELSEEIVTLHPEQSAARNPEPFKTSFEPEAAVARTIASSHTSRHRSCSSNSGPKTAYVPTDRSEITHRPSQSVPCVLSINSHRPSVDSTTDILPPPRNKRSRIQTWRSSTYGPALVRPAATGSARGRAAAAQVDSDSEPCAPCAAGEPASHEPSPLVDVLARGGWDLRELRRMCTCGYRAAPVWRILSSLPPALADVLRTSLASFDRLLPTGPAADDKRYASGSEEAGLFWEAGAEMRAAMEAERETGFVQVSLDHVITL